MVSGRALLDPGDQLLLLRRGLRLDIEETAPRHRPLGDDSKPAFHLIEQGGVDGCVVLMVPGAMADGTWDFSVAQAHRQQRLGAVQGLDQCFLVNARIGGELVAAGFREAVVFLAGAAAPRRSAARVRALPLVLLAVVLVLIGAWPAGPELVMQAFQAPLQIALTPHANGYARQLHPFGDVGVGLTGLAGQIDLGSLHD